jgi:phosphate transport system permease protein
MAKHFARKGRRFLGFNLQSWIKGFFGGNAGLSIVILFLICLFLVMEAVRFFPSHHEELKLYRKSGQEYVGYIIKESDEYQNLVSYTNQAYFQELDAKFGMQRGLTDCFGVLQGMIEDNAEDEIEALEDARDDEDPAAIVEAQAAYTAAVANIVNSAERKQVDSFSRLKNEDQAWNDLIQAALTYDAVEEETPDFIKAAEQEIKGGMASFEEAKNAISSAGSPIKDLRNKLVKIATAIKDEAVEDRSAAARKAAILKGAESLEGPEKEAALKAAGEIIIRDEFPFAERVAPISASKDDHAAAVATLKEGIQKGVVLLPTEFASEPAAQLVEKIRKVEPEFQKALEISMEDANALEWDQKVGIIDSATRFFFGREWVTNSSWHDAYGFLPLFTGSVIISMIALFFAVPVSIGAAIYVNRLSTRAEQTFIKPAIEMIQAIPSIVLGFFGIMVLGEILVDISGVTWLSWLPGFPITERLNMLNAGMLLALMAVPTIFTLCEDALNNVPQSFSEASLALGASKLQTVNKVIVPAAISGILAAVLLGLGRVIGETMVVLLVAGNKISMPDWGEGLGVVTQPTHTMTGIIAQEMGEVSPDTLHYRALFLVGLVLFTISLSINVAAQKIIKRLGKHA